MPVPAPSTPPDPSSAPTFVAEYKDLRGRPYTGRFTAKQLDPPFFAAEGDIIDGRISITLPPGRYSVGAMLRDPDGVRAYLAQEVTVQEGS
jgi:hypothetical protein